MISQQEFEKAYREKYLRHYSERLEWAKQNSRHLSEEIRKKCLKILEEGIDIRLSKALFFNGLVISTFDPNGRKIKFMPTCFTRHRKNTEVVKAVLDLNGSQFVEQLNDANTAVYFGNRICDFEHEEHRGYPVINDILREIAKRDITALLFYNGEAAEICFRHCPEPGLIRRLQQEGKKIIEFPLGRAYQRRTFLTTG